MTYKASAAKDQWIVFIKEKKGMAVNINHYPVKGAAYKVRFSHFVLSGTKMVFQGLLERGLCCARPHCAD